MGGPVAILCSGQAGQHPEMFDLIADCAACEPVCKPGSSGRRLTSLLRLIP